jgi:integrase
MELIFRQRLDRPDKLGRAAIFGDLHWAGGHRWKMPTGVKVLPAHWQPAKSKRIHTSAPDANALNLRLGRLLTAVQGVFLKAEADRRPEASVTVEELQTALIEAGTGSRRAVAAPPSPPVDPNAPLPDTASWQEFNERWKRDNKGRITTAALNAFNQVIGHLEAFDSTWCIGALTRERLTQYTNWLYDQGYKDGTLTRHYWFLRECCQMSGRLAPKWLVVQQVRHAKALGLQRAEVLQLASAPLPPHLDRDRNVFLFQMLLLLRDSDLRLLKPHHAQLRDLPGHGLTLCLELYQQKTGEPVLVPLPPLALTIWQHYNGQLPVLSNWHRNKAIREAAKVAGLTREVVTVAFSGKTKHEAVLPIWDAITTHSARHTGATLLTWASDGDQALKELALGHVSDSVYGSDTVERYGPRLLAAWQKVFTNEQAPVTKKRGQVFENRGQLPEMPPVLTQDAAAKRRFLPVRMRKTGG